MTPSQITDFDLGSELDAFFGTSSDGALLRDWQDAWEHGAAKGDRSQDRGALREQIQILADALDGPDEYACQAWKTLAYLATGDCRFSVCLPV